MPTILLAAVLAAVGADAATAAAHVSVAFGAAAEEEASSLIIRGYLNLADTTCDTKLAKIPAVGESEFRSDEQLERASYQR